MPVVCLQGRLHLYEGHSERLVVEPVLLMHRLGARVAFLQSDLFASIAGRFDLITANPPYIDDAGMAALPRDVHDFEPRLALEAGTDALSITRRIVAEAPAHLTAGGILAVETGAGHAPGW